MILKQRTAFVLGAGASHAYGFPLGRTLINDVCETLAGLDGTQAGALIEASGYSKEDVRSFRDELATCRRDSIDEFLQSRQDYDLLGRSAIVQQLLKYETDHHLDNPRDSKDWYGFLFANILGVHPDLFKANKLRIITFNFDRSFEYALYRALRANYPRADPEALLASLEMTHVHGQLCPLRLVADVSGRPYLAAKDSATIRECAAQIRIVHDSIDKMVLNRVHDALTWAERVYFLGFNYHRLNLAKLRIPESIAHLEQPHVLGTRFGVPAARVGVISEDFRGGIQFGNETDDILALLGKRSNIFDSGY